MQGESLAFVTFKEGSLYRGKQVSAQAKWSVKYNKRNNVVFNNNDKKSANTGHFWMHLLATKNEYHRQMFFSNFLDFSQFTVDSSENNTENR